MNDRRRLQRALADARSAAEGLDSAGVPGTTSRRCSSAASSSSATSRASRSPFTSFSTRSRRRTTRLHLHADVELGGTDQLFNLNVGRDIMPGYGLEPQVVMTTPLLEGLDGVEKMSKSLGNYVGDDRGAGEMFGKLMSISDDLMWRYYLLLTDLSREAIDALRREAVTEGASASEAGQGRPGEARSSVTFTPRRRPTRRRRRSRPGLRAGRWRLRTLRPGRRRGRADGSIALSKLVVEAGLATSAQRGHAEDSAGRRQSSTGSGSPTPGPAFRVARRHAWCSRSAGGSVRVELRDGPEAGPLAAVCTGWLAAG